MDFGIGSTQRLLLTAAFAPEPSSAAAALGEWWSRVGDFDAVRGTDAALFPLIFKRLGANIQNRQLAARLKGAARHHWVLNQHLIGHCSRLVDVLLKANIPVLLLKGAAISTLVDQDSGLRTMSDWDVLVPPSRIFEALRLLAAAGVDGPQNIADNDLAYAGSAPLCERKSGRSSFDLHWRPLRTIGSDDLAADMFAAARKVQIAGRSCLACSPEHLVFHAIVNGMEWSPYPRYDWLIDVIKILRRFASEFDWTKLVVLAQRYRYQFLIGAALTEASRTAAVPVPDWVARRLSNRLALFERWEARLARTSPASLSVAEDVFLLFQKLRRRNFASLRRPAFLLLSDLFRCFFARSLAACTASSTRSFQFLHGWSGLERDGRWTDSRFAFLTIHAPPTRRPTTISLRASTIHDTAGTEQQIKVFVGLNRIATLKWSKRSGDLYAQQIAIPGSAWRGDTLLMRFHVGSRRIPIKEGINSDTRGLGMNVHHVAVEPPLRNLFAKPAELTGHAADSDVLWHGWSAPESHHCWTQGSLAILQWRAARAAANTSVVIEGIQAAPGEGPVCGRLTVNNGSVHVFEVAPGPPCTVLRFPLGCTIAAGQLIELRIEIDNPRAPSQTTGAADERPLGLSLQRVRLDSGSAAG